MFTELLVVESFGKTKTFASIEALVYPACECGEPWTKHGECGGYKPSGPVVNYGTVMFRSNDRLANTLFRIENFFQKLRILRLRHV